MPNKTAAEFADWRGGAKDTHAATAMMVKTVDPQSGEIKIERQDTVGDGTTEPGTDYNETASGINITFDWQGEALEVRWSAAQIEQRSERIEIPFSKRFQVQTPSEKAVPPEGK